MKSTSWRKALLVLASGGMVFGASGSCNPLASDLLVLIVQQVVLSFLSGAFAT